MIVEFLEETESTNEYIKRYLPSGQDRIVVSRIQTGGRGTKGRSFLSEEGGAYLSALYFYKDFPARESFLIMARAAVAVCKTAEAFDLAPEIKWANDVLVSGKKLAGILVENVTGGDRVKSSIVGIGLNVCNDLSALGGIAISLSEAAGRKICVTQAREELIRNLQKKFSFEDYLSRVRFLGREVVVTDGEGSYCAKAVKILPDGRLQVERTGEERLLSAAEISLKIRT